MFFLSSHQVTTTFSNHFEHFPTHFLAVLQHVMTRLSYISFAFFCLFASAYATCGCVCDENNSPHSYIIELSGEGRECSLPAGPTTSNCYNIDCAKCGQILECYVHTMDAVADQAVCDIVNNASQFCPNEQGKNRFSTQCGQQCSGKEGVECYQGESWRECPAVLASNVARCKAGANGGPAQLRNFASYKICIGSGGATCEASGTCATDAIGGSSYHCMISAGCTSSNPVTCLSPKCDSDSSTDNTCPCANSL